MFSQNEHPNTDNSSKSGKENRCFMHPQYLCTVFILLLQSIHNKDTEIIADTKNQSSQDNIYYIEFYSANRHNPEDNNPTDTHWHKGEQCSF